MLDGLLYFGLLERLCFYKSLIIFHDCLIKLLWQLFQLLAIPFIAVSYIVNYSTFFSQLFFIYRWEIVIVSMDAGKLPAGNLPQGILPKFELFKLYFRKYNLT